MGVVDQLMIGWEQSAGWRLTAAGTINDVEHGLGNGDDCGLCVPAPGDLLLSRSPYLLSIINHNRGRKVYFTLLRGVGEYIPTVPV